MQIDVADIQKLDIKPGQVLIVSVEVSKMPRPAAQNLIASTAKLLRSVFVDPTVQIVVVPAGRYSFGVIDALTANSITNPSSPGTPGDAFDRAMKGLG